MKIGYARVSTHEQNLDAQLDALQRAGCGKIVWEKVSTRKEDRPKLKELLSENFNDNQQHNNNQKPSRANSSCC